MKLNLDKTIQASGVLLQMSKGHRMSYMRLLKLLYLSDREMLRQTGSPITYDRVVAMKHGPVLSETYSLIKGEHYQAAVWNQFFEKQGYQLEILADPGRGELSRRAISVLNKVSEDYSHLDDWRLVDYMHETLPEWSNNWPGPEADGTSLPVSYEDILRALEFDEDDVQSIAAEIHSQRSVAAG